METARIPIFPLQLVLFPRIPLPLHIFEERYRTMIRHCMETPADFGVVCHDGNKIEGAGCSTRIHQVLREYDDGELDILTVGERRFRILKLYSEKTYLEAEVAYFEDDTAAVGEIGGLADSGVQTLEELAAVAGQDMDRTVINSLSANDLSFLLANIDTFSLKEKQRFLETTSTKERLDSCISNLRETIRRLKAAGSLKDILGDQDNLSNMLN